MEVKEFNRRLNERRLGGCFVFCGDEDYLKKHYLKKLKETVLTDSTFDTFNYQAFDGETLDYNALKEAISAPPFMSDFKLIEWKYPSFDKMKDADCKKFENLLDLLENHSYITLAFITGDNEILASGKKEAKFVKKFSDRVNFLTFRKFTDNNSAGLYNWLKEHFSHEGIAVDLPAVQALVFKSGHSMSVLAGEVDKLAAYAKANGKGAVTKEDVEAVASSTPESDTFALSNAILSRNKKDAYLALDEMKWRRVDPVVILAMMAKTLCELACVTELLSEGMDASDIERAMKMHPFTLKLYIAAAKKYSAERTAHVLSELSRVDTDSKFGGVTGYTAIELFLSKCL